MSKIIKYGKDARESIKRGIDAVANTVKMTVGPKGRNVIIHNAFGSPLITNDGVTIAAHIYLKDEFEELGAQLIKQVAWNSNERAGDGTTTATILAQNISEMGMRSIERKEVNPMILKKLLDAATKKVVARIRELSIPVENREMVEQVGTVSSGDPEIGKIFGELFDTLGKDGIVTMEQTTVPGCSFEIQEGFEFDRGMIHPLMATNANRMTAELREPLIIVCDHFIASPVELAAIVNALVARNKDQALIICGELTADALEQVVKSRMNKHFNMVAVRAPGVGENQERVLSDVATLVGARFISRERGERLDSFTDKDFGFAGRVIVGKNTTRIIRGAGDPATIQERKAVIEEAMNAAASPFERTVLSERLERFGKGVGVIKIGAASETELKEKVYRVEDAINAVKYSLQEGVVPGGGVALFRAKDVLGPMNIGEAIIKDACIAPIKQIIENAGIEKDIVKDQIESGEGNIGFNAETEQVEDMVAAGIIDPTRVVISEIENATSVANTLLTIEGAICEEPGAEMTLDEIKKDFS